MERWLGGSSASLLVVIADSNDGLDLKAIESRFAAETDINIKLLPLLNESDDGHGQRDFRLVQAMHQHRQSHHKWFISIDDDTCFPSLHNLIAALEPYNPMESWYIGTLSEDFSSVKGAFGYMAYGGAGIIMLLPLLKTLDAKFDGCNVPLTLGGDILSQYCVFLHTSPPVSSTLLPGLHQLNFHGDGSGWYEGGINSVLSLHHFSGSKGHWHRFPVEYGRLVGDVCGDDCFLQRYVLADDGGLTTGYSVVQYPRGVDKTDFNIVKETFMPNEPDIFDYSLGALRLALSADEKVSWRMECAVRGDKGRVGQFYVKWRDNRTYVQRLKSELESVFEVEWYA